MPKLYASIGLILLLGLAFWYHGNSNYQSGVNAERVRWQDQVIALTKERDKLRKEAETLIVQEKVVWRDRIHKVREVVTDCQLPDVHTSVLRDSGIFTAPSR